jgi:hypothetical protein
MYITTNTLNNQVSFGVDDIAMQALVMQPIFAAGIRSEGKRLVLGMAIFATYIPPQPIFAPSVVPEVRAHRVGQSSPPTFVPWGSHSRCYFPGV